MAKHETVDDYLATLPDDRRAVMEQLRATIRAAAPDATEVISYNMPCAQPERTRREADLASRLTALGPRLQHDDRRRS